MTPQRKWLLFGGGFLGWYLVSGMCMLSRAGAVSFFLYPGTLIALLVFGLNPKQRVISFGILAALVTNFVVSLMLGMLGNAICFVPFFIK